MGTITINQIIGCIIGLASFIGAIGVICTFVSKIYSKQIKRIMKPLSEHIKEIDMAQCKNFLVRFLSDIEQNMPIDEVEKQRAHEVYEHYIELGGNSYIHDKWERLMRN